MNYIIIPQCFYRPEWLDATVSKLPNNHTLHSMPLPGSGVILTFIMNLLSGFLDHSKPESVTNYQRIVESFKFGYGKRTELGDINFVDGIDELVKNLTSVEYADYIREMIKDNQTSNDPKYYGANTTLNEDHGTANIVVLTPNGDAVAATGTINL